MDEKKNTAGDALREAADKVEHELKQTIAYINDRVVPEVRKQSSGGLRAAADKLHRLADELERNRR